MKVGQIRKGELDYVASSPLTSHFTIDAVPFCSADGSFNCLFDGSQSAQETGYNICRLLEIAFYRPVNAVNSVSSFIKFWNGIGLQKRVAILRRIEERNVLCSKIYTR